MKRKMAIKMVDGKNEKTKEKKEDESQRMNKITFTHL